MKKTTQSQRILNDPNVAYNPDYSVFNTTEKPYFINIPEEVFSEEVEDHGLSEENAEAKFIKLKTEDIKRNPFGNLLDDQQIINKLSHKYRLDAVSAGSLKRSRFEDSEYNKTDKYADLTKEEIAFIKQKEREQYYRENLRK